MAEPLPQPDFTEITQAFVTVTRNMELLPNMLLVTLSGKIDTLIAAISSTDEKIVVLQGDMTDMKKDMKKDLANVKNNLADVKKDLVAVNSKVTRIESEYTSFSPVN